MIGILKARCIFVPLDTTIPGRGIEKRIRATNIEIIFTDVRNRERLLNIYNDIGKKIHTIVVDDSFFQNKELYLLENFVKYSGEDKIYIYFTSGTTGTPRAILGKNKGLLHFIQWEIDTFKITHEFKFSQFTTPGFDVFLRDIFVPLCAGGTICIPGDEIPMNKKLVQWIEKRGIYLIHIVPSLFKVLTSGNLSKDNLGNLRFILLAGEKINPLDLQRWYDIFAERIQLVNIYGPTETTLAKAYYFIKKVDIERGTIPIGNPIRGSKLILLDKDLNICDRGIIGDIYIRTPYRSFGYINDPELNHERFIPNLFIDVNDGTDLLYRTGDLGRELPDGNFEILGRIDRQVKIRGIRIELGEIESLLLKKEEIREVVAQAKEVGDGSGEVYLCAYLQSDRELVVSELREYLLNDLPGYMVPSYFIYLHRFPLTPNGKIDLDALPLPERTVGSKYVAPRDKIEKKLVKIWCDVLGYPVSEIGIDDNFFERGGHSLKAAILASRIYKEFHVKIPLADIFNNPTLKQCGSKIRKTRQTEFSDIKPVEKKEYYELSYNQKRLWIIHQLDPASSSYHISRIIHLRHRVDIKVLRKAITGIFQRHDSLRTGFAEVNGESVQFIRQGVEIPFKVVDLSNLEESEKQKKVTAILTEVVKAPFDLQIPPLFRSVLIKQNHREFGFIYNIHHIVSDGWSMQILEGEFKLFYESYLSGKEPRLEFLQLQYKDFVAWHNQQIRDPELKDKSHHYWRRKLETGFPKLNLPTYYGGDIDEKAGAAYRCVINETVTHRLHQLAQSNNTTLFMVLFSIYNLLLAFLSGQEEIVLSIINAGRQHFSLRNIVGYFINPVLVKTRVNLEEDFDDLLSNVNKYILEAFQHQSYPFELVLDEMKIQYPTISAAFNLLNMQDISGEMELDSLEPVHVAESRQVKYPLVLYLTEYKNGIEIRWVYQKSLFKPETIESIASKYIQVMAEITGEQ